MILRVRSNLGTTKLEIDADIATESTVRARFLEDLRLSSDIYYKLTQDLSFDPAGVRKIHPSKTLTEQGMEHGTMLYCRVELETTTPTKHQTPNVDKKGSNVKEAKKDGIIETIAEEQQQHERANEGGNNRHTNQDDVSKEPFDAGEEKSTSRSNIIDSSDSQEPKKEKEFHVKGKQQSTNGDDAASPKVAADSETPHVPAEALLLQKERETYGMMRTMTGKAWLLVEGAISLQNQDIKIIAQDDIIFLAERLMVAWKNFKLKNIQTNIDIAYHHTRRENLTTIRTNGLLSRKEREKQGVVSKYNGSKYGDGIYCSLDPLKHAHRYGDTTVMLARMEGNDYGRRSSETHTLNIEKWGFCVLRSSSQCIPLFQFPSRFLAQGLDFLKQLADFQGNVQALLDKVFNQYNSAQSYSAGEIMHSIWKHHESQHLQKELGKQRQSIDLQKKLDMQRQSIIEQKKINIAKKNLDMQQQSLRRQKRINIAKKMALHKEENFLMFTQVLFKYLEQNVDQVLHSQAERILRDCTECNKQQKPGYENAMIHRLKYLVGEHHWEIANDYFFHFFYFFHSIEQEKKHDSNLTDTTVEAPLTTLDIVEGDFVPPILEEQDRAQLDQRQQQQQQQQLVLLQQRRQQQAKQRKMKNEEENHKLRAGINGCKKQISMLHDVVAKLKVRLDLDDTDDSGSERLSNGPSSSKKRKEEDDDNDDDDASDAAIYKGSSERVNNGPSSGKRSKEEENDDDNDDASDAAIADEKSHRYELKKWIE